MDSTSGSLLERLAKGADDAAWTRFVALYTPLLMHWCSRLGLSLADAADFTQEVFVVAVEQLPTFRYDPNQSFRAWLKTILMNAWRKHQRKTNRARIEGSDPEHLAQSDPGQFVDEAEHREFLVRRALTIIQADFEPITWKACWEFVVNDRPATEVAAELGITPNAVYLAKSRVLRHLRTQLAGMLD